MIKGFKFKSHSVMYTWLLSYMLVLFIPVLMASYLYMQTKDIVQKEIIKSNTFLLNKVQQHIDGILRDTERLSTEIALNRNVQVIKALTHPLTDRDYYNIYRTIEDLKTFKIANSIIDNFFIYIPEIDMVMYHGASVNSKDYFNAYCTNLDITYEQWFKIISAYYKSDFLTLPIFGSPNVRAITHIHSIPVAGQSHMAVNVVVTLKQTIFSEDTKGIETVNNGIMYVIDPKEGIVAASGTTERIDTLKSKDMNMNTGIYFTGSGSRRVAISYITSEVTGWKYVSGIPAGVFWERAEYLRMITIIGWLLCLSAGAGVSVYFLRRNYNPLKMVITAFERSYKLSFDRKLDEYSFIHQAISKALEEREKTSHRLNQQNKVMRASFLTGLLKGRETEVPVHELLSSYDIKLYSDFFSVMVFYVEDIDDFLEQAKQMDTAAAYNLVQFIITNVVEELVAQNNQGFMTEVDDMLVCIVNFKENGAEQWKEELTRVIHEAGRFIEEHYGIRFMGTMGNLHKSTNSIPVAYNEALQAMEYKKVMGNNTLVSFAEVSGLPKGDYYYPLEKEYQMINCVKAGDVEGAKALITEVFDQNFGDRMPTLQVARCLMFNMISTMMKTFNELEGICSDNFLEDLDPIEKLLGCKTVNQMKDCILTILEQVCNYITAKNRPTDYKIRDAIINYVTQNYRDENLGIATIAHHLEMNAAYISKVFKEQAGEGILEYINALRIAKAKEIMNNCDVNVDEVARRVGYNNSRTFTRAFKKMEGITPGKFKS